jgi:hypothetical protein
MRLSNTSLIRFALLISLSNFPFLINAQQVTGVWKGKIDRRKVEVKIVQNGDSLTGTSYYYESATNYRRYSIKGYFDANTNSVVWWDDQLIEDRGGNSGKNALLSVADFNCPGGGEMTLDGKAAPKENAEDLKRPVSLTKAPGPSFRDEWDYVIDNYTMGTNDPDIIDSIGLIAAIPVRKIETVPQTRETVFVPDVMEKENEKKNVEVKVKPQPKLTIEEKFSSREKIFTKEILLVGDSIELRFYDNAEVDGDSISLFLNEKLLFSHIRLTDKPYTIKLSVKDLNQSNELTMVAENLGAIPPNTSYMVAIVGDQRYDAQLASTENSSAMIRLRK